MVVFCLPFRQLRLRIIRDAIFHVLLELAAFIKYFIRMSNIRNVVVYMWRACMRLCGCDVDVSQRQTCVYVKCVLLFP